jgi:putative oxidoreductase
LQRLFSTFANGWPGAGILVLRLASAAALLYLPVTAWQATPHLASIAPQVIAAVAGIFLLVGLWAPVAGTLAAIVELWISFSVGGDPTTSLLLAALGASLAMIGPGAWSCDARLFGRKRIETSPRDSSRDPARN